MLLPLCLAGEDAKFPEPLTSKNFKAVLGSGLHLVEFFSPYCSHCKSFAPTWESTWQNFHEEGSRLGIGMVQVDCVESGDLCNEEKIRAYPALKLYGPDGFIKNYPKSFKRTEADIIKFCKQQVLELADQLYIPDSKSTFISTDQMIKILASPIDQPYLISFWPSNQLNDLNEMDESKFVTPYTEETLGFQRTWRLISNQLATSKFKTGHFNCLSNKKICKNLGFDLNRVNVGLVLSERISGKFLTYDQTIYKMDASSVIEFAERVDSISSVPSIDSKGLISLSPSIIKPLDLIPETADTYYVYLYDDETVSTEDFELLPYLIEPLASLPHTYLYKSNDEKILNLLKLQKQNLYNVINYNASEPERRFNEQRFSIETSTTLPTLLCFKQYSILPEVFQSLAPGDIRDQWRISDFLRDTSEQFVRELNSNSFAQVIKSNRKQIIQMIDSTDEKLSTAHLSNVIVGLHDYMDLSSNSTYEDILNNRAAKNSKIQKLKSKKNVDQKKVVQALAEEINYAPKEQISLLYLDLSKNSKILKDLGIAPNDFVNGDVVILDSNHKYFYDSNPYGARLSSAETPYFLRETLAVLKNIHKGSLRKRLRDSPYVESLRVLDNVHQFGVLGYVCVLVGILITLKSASKLMKRGIFPFKLKRDNKGLGILDGPMTKYE